MSERNFDFPHDLFLDRRGSFPELSQQILDTQVSEVMPSFAEHEDNATPSISPEESTSSGGLEHIQDSERG